MVLMANQDKSDTYTFKAMLLKTDKSDFMMDMLKEVKHHDMRNPWTLMKKSKF